MAAAADGAAGELFSMRRRQNVNDYGAYALRNNFYKTVVVVVGGGSGVTTIWHR